jgi:hypothetical protein
MAIDAGELSPDSSERVALVRRVLMTLSNREATAASLELSTTAHYHVPGHSRLAGTFIGREAIASHFQQVFRFATDSEGTHWVDFMEGTNLVSALVETTFGHRASRFQGMLCFIFSFGAADGVDDISLFLNDQDRFDRFFNQSVL